MDSLKLRSVYAFVWDFFGKISLQLVGFVISVVLTRILDPADFGLIAIVLIFTPIAQVVIDSGFSAALIQRKANHSSIYSSVFWVNILMGLLMTLLLFIAAPFLASFYNDIRIEFLAKLYSIKFILNSLNIIQKVRLIRALNFKLQTKISFIISAISGAIGVALALNDFGVVSLIAQQLIAGGLEVVIYWSINSWRPSFILFYSDIKKIWSFSSFDFIDKLATSIYLKLDVVLIGKVLTPAILGFYSRAVSLESIVNNLTSASIGQIFFPTISKIQNEPERVVKTYSKIIRLVGLLSIFISFYLFIVAEDLFIILFTERWIESAQMYKYLAITGFIFPVSSIMVSLINGLGFAKRNFKSGIIKKLIGLSLLLSAFWFGMKIFLLAIVTRNLIGLFVNMFFVYKTIGLSVGRQITLFHKPLYIGVIIVVLGIYIDFPSNVILSFILATLFYFISFILLLFIFDGQETKKIYNQVRNLNIR